jgi:hypothetical protein
MNLKDYQKLKDLILDEENKVTSDNIVIGHESVMTNGKPEMKFPIFEQDKNGNRLRRVANNMKDISTVLGGRTALK